MTYDNEVGTTGTTSISAMFDSQTEAQRSVDRLVAAGIPDAHIRQVSGSDATATRAATDDRDKGFWDSLSDFFFPDEDRYTYAEGLSRGGYLVTVTGLTGTEYDTALDILDDEGSINLDERAESWRSEGWGGYEASPYAAGTVAGTATTGTTTTGTTAAAYDTLAGATNDAGIAYGTDKQRRADAALSGGRVLGDDETIPVVQERLRVGKRETGHGRVRVRAYTVEEPVTESVDLREERVEIERRPVDRVATSADAAFQDRTLEAEEYREEAVVEKEARVVEEIGLRKTSETHRKDISDTVRRTEVEIDKDGTDVDRDTLAGGVRRDDLDKI